MKKKTTLQDMRDILVNSSEGSDRHIWGVVTRKNTNSQGKVTSYEVALGGDEGSMTCRKLAGADVGDTVMVTLTKKGAAIVTGTVDGDKDAENALTAATEAQQTAEAIEDLVGDGDESGIVITTQYYLSTSNTEPTGGTWQDTLPTYVAGSYYWTKTITEYADGSTVESDPILDVGSQIAAELDSVVTAENQHFWHDSSGAYVTKSNQNLSSGYAMKITSNGLLQTYNGNNLMSLTSSGLTFYQSDGSTSIATYSSAGCYLYGNGTLGASITSSGATFYGGSSNNYASMSSSGLNVYYNGTSVATFGSSVRIGSSSGTHLTLSSGNFNFYNSSGSSLAALYVHATVGSSLYLGSGTSAYVHGNSGSIALHGTGGSMGVLNGIFVNVGTTEVIGNNGTRVRFPVAASDTIGTGSNTTALRINTSGGGIGIGGSAKRLKEDISYTLDDEFNPDKLYNVNVAQFRYKKKYDPDNALQIGLIADDVLEQFPTAAILDEKKNVIDWNERILLPAMLKLIQEQHEEIEAIKSQLH